MEFRFWVTGLIVLAVVIMTLGAAVPEKPSDDQEFPKEEGESLDNAEFWGWGGGWGGWGGWGGGWGGWGGGWGGWGGGWGGGWWG